MIYTSNDAHKTSSGETVWMSWQNYLQREKSLQKNLPIILSNHHLNGTETNLVVKQPTGRNTDGKPSAISIWLRLVLGLTPSPTFLHTHPQYAWHHPVIWTPARRGKEHLVPFHWLQMHGKNIDLNIYIYTWKTKCTFFFRPPPIHLDSSVSLGTCWRRYVLPPRPQRSIADLRRRPSAPPPGTSSFERRGELTPRCFSNGAVFFWGEAAYVTMGNGDNLYPIWKNRSQNGNIISQNLWNKYRGL